MPPSSSTPSGSAIQGGQSGSGAAWRDREPPPVFDGRQPDKSFPKWLKELDLWKFETEIPKEKWGVKVWRQLEGSARAVADSLTFEELACEKGLDNLLKVLKEHYEPHLEVSLPKAFEDAIYGDVRSSKESFGDYVIRMEKSIKELERQGVTLHDIVVGYVMFRHANLSDVQESQMLTWGAGKYDRKTVVANLRRLEKGVFDVKRRSTHYLMEDGDPPPDETEGHAEVFHQEDETAESDLDEEYIYIGEDDLQDVYEEEHVMEALATYQDIRRSLRDQKNNRGFYPSGKGGKRDFSKGKGKGGDRPRPMLDIKGAHKPPMKFGGKGTKVHVDLLKLRTKCARCGTVGHWARECRNPPDERGRQAQNRSMSTGPSSVSSPSTRSGFYVETSQPDTADSKSWFQENKTLSYMSFVPTFGSLMSSVLGRSESVQIKGDDEMCESFVGVSTTSGEGIVDTAAQDGLIGKAALLQLTETLRGFGLQIRWNHEKKAQASGVGGKAKVIGIAELPIGLAGVNGLLEVTVVQDNVPLLLPVKLLRQLRAVVDLDDNLLRLKAYGVETKMHELPSGHLSVSVTSYAPEGWSLPRAAQSHALKPEQYVLVTSGFLNQSMSSLESSRAPSVKFDTGDLNGKFATAPDDGSKGQGCAGASREAGSVSPPKPPCSKEVENDPRENVRPDDVRATPRKGYRMAARWLIAAVGAGNFANGGPGFSYYSPGVFLNRDREAVGVCQGDPCGTVSWATQDEGATGRSYDYLSPSGGGTQGLWQPVLQGDLVQPLQSTLGVPQPGEVGPGRAREGQGGGAHELRGTQLEDRGDSMHMPEGGGQACGQESGSHTGTSLLQVQAESVRVLPVGSNRAGEDSEVRRSDGDGDRGGLGEEPDGGHDECPGHRPSTRSGRAQDPVGLDARVCPAMADGTDESEPRQWLHGWFSDGSRPSVTTQGLPQGIGPENSCLVSTGPQLRNARRKQMQAFCLQPPTPWSMSMASMYYVWDVVQQCWLERNGWLPRVYEGHVFLVCFQDENNMVFWSEEDGKSKALSAGERKKTMKALDDALKSASALHGPVLEAVSPAKIQCFVEYGNSMATLDPGCSRQFWKGIKEKDPEVLILRPDRDDQSVNIAADAAEWQSVRGKVFAVVCQHDNDVIYYENALDQGCLFQQCLPSSEVVLTNCAALGKRMTTAMEEDRVLNPEDTNDLLQNPKAHQSENEQVAQNVTVLPEYTDDLLQNPEAHQSFLFDVCQEHGGPLSKDVCQEHGGPLSEQFLSSVMATDVENRSRHLLQQQDYSLMSLEKLLMTLPLLQPRNRQSTMQGSYFSLGLFAHGNHYGVTRLCEKLPTFTKYVNQVMQYQCKCQGWTDAKWTTIAIGQNAGSSMHRDNHNQANTLNYIFSLGRHRGGELWTQGDVGSPTTSRTQWKELPNGDRVHGCLHDIHYKLTRFNPKKWHSSAEWTGQRFVISAFTSRAVERVGKPIFTALKEFGFPLFPRKWIYMFNGQALSLGEDAKIYVEDDQEFALPEDDLLDELPAQGEENQGEDQNVDMEPTREEKRLVLKLHENMGHPAPREMARAMRIARVKPHILRYIVKKFSCAVCESKPKPRPSRPAVLPRTYEPGRVVGVDVIWLGSLDRRQCFPALNMVDWGTGYSMVERLKNTEATHTWRTFMRTWGRTFGVPEIIVADLGSEFRGHFAQMAGEAGALIRHTAARSPWQAGKTERAGAHFKWVYDKARDSTFASTWEEIKTLMLEVESARNRYGNRSGFSPMQRQIGHNLRLPGSLLSDDHLDPSLVIQSSGEEMRRVLEIRKAAQEAYMKSQMETAITKAKNARARIQVEFLPGETVYVFRQPKERKRRHVMTPEAHEGRKASWVGPGVVLAVEKPSLWISMKGELWKVSQEQCRHATSEEQVAKEMLAGELEALREELGRTSLKRTYRDMTGEPCPPDEDEANGSHDDDRGVQGDLRPAQRVRLEDPSQVPIPEDEELDYEPSYEDGEQGHQQLQEGPAQPPLQPQGEPPQHPQQPQEFVRARTESEPEPLPTPQRTLTPETARAVQRNEELDGNFRSPSYRAVKELAKRRPPSNPYFVESKAEKGQHGWVYFEKNKWEFEADQWEFVNPNVVIRRHYLPRDRLCNPNKVQGALMPRRLKLRQSYMVTEDGKVDKVNDLWFKERKNTCKTKHAWVGFTVFSNKEVNIENFVATKARGQGEVFEHEISAAEWPAWRKTDRGEWDKVVATGAIKVLSLERSREIRNGPERSRIVPSRMVRRWKPADQPGSPDVMKSRWCLRGDRDPDLLDLDRHAPTLNTTSFGVLLQIAASLKHRATVGDLKNAFCQSLPLVRKNGALYASLPKGGIEGLHEEQLVEVVAGVYGLGDSPKHWRKTLREAILELGYRESVMDPTVYYLQTDKELDGVIAVEVDDLFTFGNSEHEKRMQALQEKFKFGKYEDVMDSKEGVSFNGRRIHQKKNYEFEVDMHKFVSERLSPVQLSKGRRSEPKALANDSEINQMRAVIGALNWLAKEGRPDAAAAASLGASTFPKPVIQDVLDVNAAVKLLKERPDLTIKIRSIEPSKLAWGVISDASFGNAYAGHSQGAYAVLAFDEKLKDGFRVPCSLISWRSGRIQKVVNSTLAAETQSLSKGLGELSWIVTLYNELTDPSFDLMEWEAQLKRNRVLAMAPDTSSDGLKSSLCIIDAKALFDHLSRETTGPSQDKRTGLEIQVVRQHMNSIAGEVRWIPHPHMVVDGLTKRGSNMQALYQLLDSGEFQIVDVAEVLEDRRRERQERGYNKR